MSLMRIAFESGGRAARAKFALGPPTQVDQFVADVENGQDVPPSGAVPPMSHAPGDCAALDGTMPLQLPQSTSPQTPPNTVGSTVGSPPQLAGAPGPAPQSMGALRT
jgi:hypothetical protein